MTRCAETGCPGEGRIVAEISGDKEHYAVECAACGLRSPWHRKARHAVRWWDRRWHEAHKTPPEDLRGTAYAEIERRMDALGVPRYVRRPDWLARVRQLCVWHEDLLADIEAMRDEAARRDEQLQVALRSVGIGKGERG